jgi:ribosomal silencing factor RsfS
MKRDKAENQKRADAAFDAVERHNWRRESGTHINKRNEEEYECAIVDLLTNLRHLCDRDGFDYYRLDKIACHHHFEER